MPFTSEETTCCTNEAVKGANKSPRNPPSCFFISPFTVSVIPSINTSQYSNYFIAFLISSISSFKINKVKHFPSLTAPFPVIFLSNLNLKFKVKLLTNPGKFSLAKEIEIFVSAFFLKLPN